MKDLFTYELMDLLLFDWTTLKTSIRLYADRVFPLSISGLGVGTIALFLGPLRQFLSAILLTLCAIGWIISGYVFFLTQFSEIYWVADYLGVFLIAMGILLFVYALLRGKNINLYGHRIVLGAIALLVPAFISYLVFRDTIVTLSSSSVATAPLLLVLALYYKERYFRLLTAIALIWSSLSLGAVLLLNAQS